MQADLVQRIDDKVAIKICSAIRSSLRPDGKLYLHTPNLDFFMERAKDIGVLKQFLENVTVHYGEGTIDVLIESDFNAGQIKVETIAHYSILKVLHPLGKLPVVGKYFQSRLGIEASV